MNNNDNLTAPIFDTNMSFDHSVLFGMLIPIFILSIVCYLYIFIQLRYKLQLCRDVHNHLILIILIYSFLQVISEQPLTLSYLYKNVSLIQSENFCKFWCAQDFIFGTTILMLMCYSSIERYLFIFHHVFMFRHLIILHYLPITICIIYPFLFYMGVIYFYPCINYFDYTMNTCGAPCYSFDRSIGTFDVLFNLGLIEIIGVVTNIILISRVLYKKYRMRQQNIWKKNRRLLIQVLSITLLHNIILFFTVVFLCIQLFSPIPQPILVDITYNKLSYGLYFINLLCPFMCLYGLPQLWPHSITQFLKRFFNGNRVQATINAPTNVDGRMLQQMT